MGGGQKNTGKHRPKRPDLRANAKKRQVERTKAYEAKEGVTYATKRAEKKRKLEAGEDVKKERKFDNQVCPEWYPKAGSWNSVWFDGLWDGLRAFRGFLELRATCVEIR